MAAGMDGVRYDFAVVSQLVCTTRHCVDGARPSAQSDVLDEKNGIPTQNAREMRVRELIDAYLIALKPHVTDVHLNNRKAALNRLTSSIGIAFVKDVTPERVEAIMAEIEDRGSAARTGNIFLSTVKAMFNWAVHRRKLVYNPINCVKRRPDTEKRRARRALTEKELEAVLRAAAEGPLRRAKRAYKSGLIPLEVQADLAEQGRRNVLIYTILAGTGLRVDEARHLTWADVDLEVSEFTTRSWWPGNKNSKEETLPLAPHVRDALKQWREKHKGQPQDRVVEVPAGFVRTFDEDLLATGLAKRVKVDGKWRIEKRDAAGRTMDLHALRHTFGTMLVNSGADIKTVQTLMRHSTPVLTLGIYVHMDRSRMLSAVATLAAPKAAELIPSQLQAAV